jgi:NADP-dependent 3-hydroxy acid dehydrogenase YdfG
MRDLTERLVWITGAGSGIGAAAARRLARAGCRLVLSGRRREPLQSVADEIGARAAVEVLDVADRTAVADAGERIAARHGPVDILVNNAGINVPKRHWRDVGHDDWEAVVQINVNGLFYCTQAVLPAMRARGEGLIVNISSWAGARVSYLTGPAYTAAKHAVNALT